MFVSPFVEKKSLAELQPYVSRVLGKSTLKRLREEVAIIYSVNPARVGWGDSIQAGPHSAAMPADSKSEFSATPVQGRAIVECNDIAADPLGNIVRGYKETEISANEIAQDIVDREKRLGLFTCEEEPIMRDGVAVGPPAFLKAKAEATETMKRFFREQFELASATWHQHHDFRRINDMHRAAAAYLYKVGAIGQPPEWATGTIAQDNEECVRCGQPKRKKFPVCPSCQWDKDAGVYAGAIAGAPAAGAGAPRKQ